MSLHVSLTCVKPLLDLHGYIYMAPRCAAVSNGHHGGGIQHQLAIFTLHDEIFLVRHAGFTVHYKRSTVYHLGCAISLGSSHKLF